MPIIFDIADPETTDLLNSVLAEYHQPLVDANVNVGIIMQTKIDEDEQEIPSLKHHGAYAAAVVRVVSRKNRLFRKADAEITIDAAVWKTLSVRSKKALLDHEVNHLVVSTDKKTSKPKVDDLSRPMLSLIPDDFTLTGFLAVVTRHGDAAMEYQSVVRIHAAVLEALKKGTQTLVTLVVDLAKAS